MNILRTPETAFANLPEFPFEAHYVEVDAGLRMHYVDEGPAAAPAVLLLHGEPTWGYLYRKMIPPLKAAGFRVVVPDLVGFGKSDKPADVADYSYEAHERWLTRLIDGVGLADITLFCQDWGALLGLRLAGLEPHRWARVMVANGFLPTATTTPSLGFRAWRAYARYTPRFPVGSIVRWGTVARLPASAMAAYDAPFPTEQHKAGARAFPRLVPTVATDPAVPANRRAWDGLARFEKPFLCVFGKNDPVLGRADRSLIAHVPGARGQPHDRIRGGHFIQEDAGPELAERLLRWARPGVG
jgi:haloalkane dehalogenase